MILELESCHAEFERDGAFWDPRLSWTISCWYAILTSTPSGSTARNLVYQGGDAFVELRSQDDTNDVVLQVGDGTTLYQSAACALTLGTRVYVAATYDAATHVLTLVVDGVAIGTMSHDMSGWDFVGGDTTQYWLGESYGDQAIERVRIWQRALNLGELQAEQLTATARSTVSLLADNPLLSTADVTDHSGNGRTFTTVGACLSYLAGPSFGYTCTGHVPAPTGSITVAIHNHLPFGVSGGVLRVGHWGFGYFYCTGPGGPGQQRTATVILATLTVTSADCGSLGNCVFVDISGTIPGDVDPYINDCSCVVVNLDTGQEARWDAWPGSVDGVIPPNLCGTGTYPGAGQPYGSWSFTNFSVDSYAGGSPFGPLVTADTTVRPLAATPIVLTNAELTIGETWIILTTRTGAQYVWSDRALPDPSTYYLGWKEPRVLAWGKISRALSNVLTGQYENAVFTVDLDDTDRLLRGLDDDRDLIGASVLVHMISDVGRRARLVARTVFRGLITDAQPTATLRYTLTMKDPFAEHVATHTPPPMRVFNTADFPNCALDKVPCSANAYLVNGAILAGVTVVVVDTGYGIFAPGAVFTFAGHATVYTVSSSTLTDPETSVTFSPALTSNVANNEAITVQASFTVPTAVGQRVQVPYGAITDYHLTSGVDDGDGQGPMVYVGDRVLADGKTYGEFIWSAAACYSPSSKPFQMLYFFNNPLDAAGSVAYGATAVTFSDLTTEAGSGGRIALPGYANWATLGYTHTYIDINGRRYTRLFLRGMFRDWALGILKAPDNLGGVPFAVNAYGCETVGNATGTLITNGLLQYLHVLQNWLPPIGDCYQTGAWKTTPLYPDGWPMIDEASFAAADVQSAVYVSTGFRGDFLLFVHNDQTSARDLVARFNLSFGVQSGWNNNIQFFVSLVNTDLGSITLADPLGYERDIFAGSFTITGVTRDLYTAIMYRHTQDYLGRAPDGWRSVVSGVTEVENTGATSDYGGKTTYQTLFLYMVRGKNRSIDADDYARGTDTATAVLALTLARVSAIQHLPVLGTGPAGFSYELGDVVPVTHYEGLSTAGWIARPIRIERVEIDPSQFISGLEGYDLDPLL